MGKELTEKDEGNTPASAAREAGEEVFEIDPADFIDPEEFGIKRLSQRVVAGPWGCVWCKTPLPTKQEMVRHHARHCSEDIARGNKRWNLTPDG
jgi:hypothetical protein